VNVYMLVSKEKRKYASVLQLLLLLLLLRKKQRNGISIKVPTDRILPSLLHFFSYIFFFYRNIQTQSRLARATNI